MRILLVHNKYKLPGGEDSVFEAEKTLLESNNHLVRTLLFENSDIDSLLKKVKLGYELIYNKRSGRLMDEVIRDFNPDVIHVHNLFYLASPSILFVAHKNKVPVVVTLHNYRLLCVSSLLMRESKPCELCVNKTFPVDGVRYRCYGNSRIASAHLTLTTGIHKVMKTWNNKVAIYIALTEFAKDKFIHSSLKLQPQQIAVKPNSTDNVEPLDPHDRGNYFLFIGRLSNEKGIEVLLKAFESKEIKVEIIGDGPLKDVVEKSSTANANISYLGYREKPQVISRLRKCKALIVPSVCYESLPTAVLEAFSTGTPIIISDIGNLNEIVTHRYNGLHFRTNDPQDLFRVVTEFNEQFAVYQELYANARKSYLERYTHQINYEALIEIYRSAKKSTF